MVEIPYMDTHIFLIYIPTFTWFDGKYIGKYASSIRRTWDIQGVNSIYFFRAFGHT